ncbi:MAG: DNA methyltransferase [Janthinobacterium lividum]
MIEVYEPMDVFESMKKFKTDYGRCKCSILDPWYNKGFGGHRDDYDEFIVSVLDELATFSDHIYFWGFPEIVARFIGKIPQSHHLTAWLTWYYKNNPSVIRGWRSAQNACLHISEAQSKLYPEHFLNRAQLAKKAEGKLRYMPGPPSVLEAPLNIGFIGKQEQTGHPSQKPMSIYERLIRMVTRQGDMVFDPMCGSGTTGTVCRVLGRQAVLADINPTYIKIVRDRLDSLTHDQILIKKLQLDEKNDMPN